MKKFLHLLFVLILFSFICTKSEAMNFTEGYNNLGRKPMILLLYAPWVDDYQSYSNMFKSLQAKYGTKCNFVELDIADKETQFFNQKYNIYQNLPYALFFKNERNVRFLDKNCLSDTSCMIQRLNVFLQ